MAEFDLIDLIRTRCALTRADVRIGIGDDGAVLAPPPGQDLVISTDTLVAGVHFPLTTRAEDIGWKSLAVNLSDLAAMGATPAWALLALTLPGNDRDFVVRFATGFAELAAQHHVALVGGDITQGPLSITVVVHGFIPPGQAVRRDGAQAGDTIFVTGTLGDAAAALRCLDKGDVDADDLLAAPAATREFLIARLHRPVPRVAAGTALRGIASACIDISDGLLADLGHIARASGVGIEIDAEALPASPALLALFDAQTRCAFELGGGDDYELAFSVSPARIVTMTQDLARLGCGATRIGRVVAGSEVRALDAEGRVVTAPRRGWEHFA